MSPATNRIPLIDQMRGIAVLLMAIFHFCYDLGVFGFIEFNSKEGFFPWFRFVIVTLFFLSVGAGLYLAHTPHIRWKKFATRALKITAGALVITISTLILYPKSWVWFGVLHFIAVSSLLALPFVHRPKTALVCGVMIFVLFNTTDWFNLHFLWVEFNKPLHLPRGTQDLTRLIPWLGMVLIGIYVGYKKAFAIPAVPFGWFNKPVDFLSKHALLFYLLHQPPLFGFTWLLDKIFH